MTTFPPISPSRIRLAGLLYLVIIVCGVAGEAFLRGPLIDRSDPSATAEALAGAPLVFRFGIAMDVLMALADVGLAALLYVAFEPVNRALSLAAMVFRLVQASILGLNLLNLTKALALTSPAMSELPGREAMIVMFLESHAMGYDFGLFFFGINCLLVGALILRTPSLPRWLGHGMNATGAVYLLGSTLHLLTPHVSDAFAAAYLVPLLAELAFCTWLLVRPTTLSLDTALP